MNQLVKELHQWLLKQQTKPELRRLICMAIKNWKTGQPITSAKEHLRELIQEQTKIGWHNFMFGLVSKRWAVLQHKEYRRLRSQRTGLCWVSALIQKLWDISWDMWMFRNNVLHKGNKIEEYHDPESLRAEVIKTFRLGIPRPCPIHYRPWFNY